MTFLISYFLDGWVCYLYVNSSKKRDNNFFFCSHFWFKIKTPRFNCLFENGLQPNIG